MVKNSESQAIYFFFRVSLFLIFLLFVLWSPLVMEGFFFLENRFRMAVIIRWIILFLDFVALFQVIVVMRWGRGRHSYLYIFLRLLVFFRRFNAVGFRGDTLFRLRRPSPVVVGILVYPFLFITLLLMALVILWPMDFFFSFGIKGIFSSSIGCLRKIRRNRSIM